ncbi:MAG TPA: DHH family phosphoesterase [bacterium]
MAAVWDVAGQDPAGARALAAACGLHPVTAQLLLNRGVRTAAEARRFVAPELADVAEGPALPDLAEARARLLAAAAAGERVLVFGDGDVDGLTASVLITEALSSLGLEVIARQSDRISDGYGMPERLVGEAVGLGVGVAVLVDCGTNQPQVIEALRAAGIDAIVIDHHVPLAPRAEPLALVNPHAASGRAGRELCSAGLALKVALALRPGDPDSIVPYLDLAALGTLADCSPLSGDNRAIVTEGLAQLARTPRPGLARLCQATGVVKATPEQVLRRLVPRLNAVGRLGHPEAVWGLLGLRVPPLQCDAWLLETAQAHAKTKELYRRTMGEALEQIHRRHFRDQHVLLVSRDGWHQGLMGPLASSLANAYDRPAIAIACRDQAGTGSGRSVPAVDLLKLLDRCREVLVKYGGHARACGLTVMAGCVEPLREQVNAHARESVGPDGLRPVRTADLELPLPAVTADWALEAGRLAPFGHGNPRPAVVVRRVSVEIKSPRRGWVAADGRRIPVKGALPPPDSGMLYDVLASPSVEAGEVVLTLRDAKISAAP